MYSAVLNNGIPITLYYRAVKPDGSVEAVAPWRMSRKATLILANERADLVRKHCEKFLAAGTAQYSTGERAVLCGQEYPLQVMSGRTV